MRRRQLPLAVSGLLSLAAGLFLALLAFGCFYLVGTFNKEGGYCSQDGIGEPKGFSRAKKLPIYATDWTGFPPRERCRVYVVDDRFAGSSTPEEQLLRMDPSPDRVLAERVHPTSGQYAWIATALVLPAAAWGFLAGSILLASRRAGSRGR